MQLTVTVAPIWKLLPWIVISLPPSQTLPGTMESTLGGGLMVSSMSLLDLQLAGAGLITVTRSLVGMATGKSIVLIVMAMLEQTFTLVSLKVPSSGVHDASSMTGV